MQLNQLKIGRRLNVSFAAMWALMIVLAGVGYLQFEKLREEQALSNQQDRHAALASEWRQLTNVNLSRTMALLLAPGNPGLSEHFTPLVKATSEEVSTIQKELEQSLGSDEEKALMAQIAERRQAYIAAREEAFKLSDTAEVSAELKSKLTLAAQAYTGAIDALARHQKSLVAQHTAQMEDSIRRSDWLLLGLVVLGVGLGSLLNWSISRSVTEPIERAVSATRTIASGDLTATVQVEGNDELSQLQRALAQMQESLRQLVSSIRHTTDSISTASVQIASGNLDLGQRTEQTSSNLQQTTSSMDALTTNVRQSADSARQANQLASSAAEVAARGGQVVSQVVSTMDEINTSSKKIADIIGVIDGIAFQTNILALNAAVEAARAGEQGRGFAVVAAEVRSLAGRSAEAAKEIKSLIGASVERVETGSRLVEDAGATMQEIVTSVQRVSDIIGEISAASTEQSAGISQVNTAVVQLDQMTQQNAALVEQGAAAAESLRDQAQRLTEVVNTFKLSPHAEARTASASKPVPSARATTSPARATPPATPPADAPGAKSAATARAPAAPAPVTTPPPPPPAPASRSTPAEDDWETF